MNSNALPEGITYRMVAQESGVCRTTVFNVVKNRDVVVNPHTRDKVLRTITKLTVQLKEDELEHKKNQERLNQLKEELGQ